jgi:hypothetical protein
MYVRRRSKPLVYYPDLIVTVDRAFAEALEAGSSFALAASEWRPHSRPSKGTRRLVIEIKDDHDPRNEDEEYRTKLELAAEVYGRIGLGFLTIVRAFDLEQGHRATVTDIAIDRFTCVSLSDVGRAITCIEANGGSASLEEVSASLGMGVVGKAKLSALHVRRVVSIDLRKPLQSSSPVQLISDGHAILRQ